MYGISSGEADLWLKNVLIKMIGEGEITKYFNEFLQLAYYNIDLLNTINIEEEPLHDAYTFCESIYYIQHSLANVVNSQYGSVQRQKVHENKIKFKQALDIFKTKLFMLADKKKFRSIIDFGEKLYKKWDEEDPSVLIEALSSEIDLIGNYILSIPDIKPELWMYYLGDYEVIVGNRPEVVPKIK